jgi:glycosyltransferase involved in cell wall biosynthesis
MTAARLCLNMIVKDEAAIIERCLDSVAPHIACYVVCDTGSSDGTPEIIRARMDHHGVPGEIVHTTFENFEQARNAALDLARASKQEFDYLLLTDADMELRVDDPAFRHDLREPVYRLLQRNSAIEYGNVRLVHRAHRGRYVGRTHEYYDGRGCPSVDLGGAWFYDHAQGSSRSVKFERDIRLLTETLADEPDNTRAMFYLAQSYRDSGQAQLALETYQRRVAMGGWAEEVWYAAYQVAVLSESLELDDATVVARYLDAYNRRPTRIEPLVKLARYYRLSDRPALALLVARQAMAVDRSEDVLFVEHSAYEWQARDEFSIAAYWTGDFTASAEVCQELLASPLLPAQQRSRVEDNLSHAARRLTQDSASA